MMNDVFFAFGSNKGNRLKYMLDALYEIISCGKFKISKISKFYETKPYGEIEQENFINCAAWFKTKLQITEILDITQAIEIKLGRRKSNNRWGPREIDIDILFFNDVIYKDQRLTIPHKEILKRDFVLIPLIEIAEDYIHPEINTALKDIDLSGLEKCIINHYTTDFEHFSGEVIGRY